MKGQWIQGPMSKHRIAHGMEGRADMLRLPHISYHSKEKEL